MKKILTVCMIQQPPRILLGMKKAGFGIGMWNGFGGKVEEGESIENAAKREVLEECGLTVIHMEKVGVVNFTFQNGETEREVHIFNCEKFSGEPVETDEMRPEWFQSDNLPLTNMWPADTYWLPVFLSGKKFVGKFLYDKSSTPEHMSKVVEKNITEVDKL